MSRRGISWLVLLVLLACRAAAADYEFRYKRADAESVSLMSDFNNWKAVPMTKGSDGVWTAKAALPAGTHAYKFLVNGTEWVMDPDSSKHKLVDGVENSAAEVGETSTPRPVASVAPFANASSSQRPIGASSPAPALAATPGEIAIFEVPVSEKLRQFAARSDGNPNLQHARVAVAVPQGFDPQKSWPVLVVCNTEAYSNIDSLRQFKDAATAEGWVVLAADSVERENGKEGADRWPCIGAAFDYLTAAWPAMRSWPVASGGMSGGAKNGALVAAEIARNGHRVIGMLMMGCNQDMASVAYRNAAPPNFLSAVAFLSSGKNDTIATPSSHERVRDSLKHTGFKAVRLESFDGAHDIYPPHISEALRWFVAQSSGTAATPTPGNSELDKFFKKKP
ncbi:MAG: glycogen-binding domain-containing protein [Verrucomicrobiota bacterium]|nr:glycogen-binding domain-containing protein [Verrucomicrobiota bacterium]